ncbi:MAG: PAS domain S-box protein [Sulfuritalea sp.]|nr:PAS domain S-box protein [Sulfuritalea sp.]
MKRSLSLAAAYFATGWLGLQLPFAGVHITLIWLPTGIAVAALIRWGNHVWPGIFLGALLVNLSVASSWPLAAAIATGNTLGPLLAALGLRRAGFHAAFDRQQDVGLFVVAAITGMAVSATGGSASLYLAALVPADAFGYSWLSWWMGDTVGVLLAAPVLLTLTRNSVEQLRSASRELMVWTLLAGAVAWIVFVPVFERHDSALPLAFLPLPLLIWATLRFGGTGAALAGLAFSVTAALSTANGRGPFVLIDTHVSLIMLWSYMATIVLMVLLVIALLAERLRTENSLRESELKLRAIIDTEPECVKMLAADGSLLQMNRAGLDMIEADSADQVVGKKVTNLILAPYRNAFSELTRRAFEGESGSLEFEICGLKGGSRWLDSHVVPLRDAHGVITAALGVTRDVTERKLAEAQLRQSERRFSTAFSSSPVAASITAAEDGCFIDANASFERDFGWSREDLIGKTTLEAGLWPDPKTRQLWWEAMRRERRLIDFESIWMHKNGEPRHVSLSAEITELEGKQCILGFVTDISARKKVEKALLTSETRLRAVLDGVQSGVITITEQGVIESFNHSAEQMFDYLAADVIGRKIEMLMPEPYRSEHDQYLNDYLRTGVRKVINRRREVSALRKDGSSFPIELGVTETELDGRKLFIGSISDISFRKKAEAELRIAAAAFESQEGTVVTDERGVILKVNQAFVESTGYTAEEAIGQTPSLLKSGRHDAAFYAAMWESIKNTGSWQGEIWDKRKDGEVYPKWLIISAVKSEIGAVTHYVGTHHDITERKIAEAKIKDLAFFDPLTRLPNRTLLRDRLKQSKTLSHREGTCGAVMFIDLDRFKTLNDTLGHDMGDLLLKQVAERLISCVREGDTVARLGGDEFVVVLGGLSAAMDEAAAQAEAVGEKLLAALNQTYRLVNVDHRSGASIGITLFRGHEASIDDVLKQADLAMYKSKESGRNALHFFDPRMETAVVERASMETALREAIDKHQFVLHYQAQVVEGGGVSGAEALLRWLDPQRGLVSPGEFIPLAEETGLIWGLGNWVLESACTQLAQWAGRPEMAHLSMAVNVSAEQFRKPAFVDQVLGVLERTQANPQRLKLELTESLLVSDVEEVIKKMTALKARGVSFSLDDFGTGYSSLSYLKRLPLSQLKIDQSFVNDILTDPNDAAIARTIVALAESLGLEVIAEGVENESQRAFLVSSGCRAFQGYFFSRPLPIRDFEEYALRKCTAV